MKVSVFLFITLMVLACSTTCQQLKAADGTPIGCPNNNPFINNLKHLYERYSTPKMGVNVCGNEWKLYGTCCNEWQLPYQAIHDTSAVKSAVTLLNQEYGLFADVLPKLYRMLKEMAFLPQNKWDDFNNQIRKAREILDNPETTAYFNEFMHLGTTDVADFQKATTACWDRMTKARSASLCSTCSGRSQYFFKNGKAWISEPFCQAIISDCHYSLKQTVAFTKALKEFWKLQDQFLTISIQTSTSQKLVRDKTELYENTFSQSQVPQILQNYTVADLETRTPIAFQLCDKFIKLNDLTFVERVSEMFSSKGSVWQISRYSYVDEHYRTNKASVDQSILQWETAQRNLVSQTSNWGTRRMLALTGSASVPALVTSDSNILHQKDSSHTTYAGGAGQIADASSAPMSLEISFP